MVARGGEGGDACACGRSRTTAAEMRADWDDSAAAPQVAVALLTGQYQARGTPRRSKLWPEAWLAVESAACRVAGCPPLLFKDRPVIPSAAPEHCAH